MALSVFVLLLLFCQIQALVGFEKTIQHLDEHVVEIGSKVSSSRSITSI